MDVNNINYNNNIFDYSNEKKDNSNSQINNNISNSIHENEQIKLLEENPALREKQKKIKNNSFEDIINK